MKIKIFVITPYEDSKIPFTVYADLEYLIEKIDGCKNNAQNSFTAK